MLTDANGNPLPKTVEPKEGHDLISCEVLVSDIERYNVALPINTPSPRGMIQIQIQQALTGLAKSLYQVMKHANQKEVVIRIQDLSSELVKEKQLVLGVGQLLPPEKEEQNDTEEKER